MELGVAALLVVVSVSLAQEDLEGKMFVFPKETNTAHVILRPTITEPLQKVSICLRTYSDPSRQYSLFCLVTPANINAFVIRFQAPTTYTVFINYVSSVFTRDSEPQDWSHTCVTWDSKTMVVQLWVDGKSSTKGYIRGSSIVTKSSIILGQEQGFYGGGFDASQSLVGEISDFHMWDYVLTREDIQKVISGDLNGNIINWKSLLYEMKEDVLLQPNNLHMEGKVFVFPREAKTPHVILRPTITRPLQKVSVCLRSYSDLSRPYTVFSLASPREEKAFLISIQPPHTCSVYINQEVTHFRTDSESLRHTCVTWDSDTGVVQLWVNGKLYREGVSMKGSSIAAEASIVLGQEQGSFDASQSLIGEIDDIHMWDYVLTPEDIKKVISGDLHGNVINWLSLHYEIKGEVLVQPQHQHLEGKMFVFPKKTNTAHVILRPRITEPLQKVSICLRTYSELSHQYSLFSVATPPYSDIFLIKFQPPTTYTVSINQGSIVFKRDSEPLDWSHTCVTWDSKTGVVQLWANGKNSTKGYARGQSLIVAKSRIILRQGKGSSGGGFDSSQSFVGEISDVHMWDYELNPEDIQKVLSGDLHGNVLNWESLLYEMKGDVLLQPITLHMEGKIFVFPHEANTSHVILRPTVTRPLQKVTVCLRSYSDLSRSYTVFSVATPGKERAFLISIHPPHTCSLNINQEVTSFKTDSESLRHTCVTWDSDTGVVQLWVNGKLYPEGVSMKGSSIAAEASIVLGQEQDSFNASQSLVGEIGDVHMWDYVLTPEDIKKVLSGDLHGNVINWLSLHYEIKGDVLVQLPHQHLEGKVFFFPKETNTAHVILRPIITRSLWKASICLRSYSDLSRPYTLFSMATSTYPDAFHIYLQPPYTYIVFINSVSAAFTPNWKPFYGRHICVTWDSSHAGAYLWLNGKLSPESRQYSSKSIAAESSIVLGQDQDSFGGGFDASQSLVGEISDVHMWDYVLTTEDIQKVLSGDLHGNIINWKSLRCEIKGEVLVKPEPQHLESKVFVFPKETDTDHVILKPTITRPLQEVSVCLRSFTQLSRPYTPFSLATPGKDNAFVIYLQPPDICSISINQKVTEFKTDTETLDWRHICVTWDSNTGVVQLWVNGKLYPRRVSMKGSSITTETSIVLGQEQDSFGGKFDEKQSLVGELSDVHMWDYVLTPEDIKKVINDAHKGNIINWRSLYYEIKGEVLVQPKFQ